MGMILDRWNAMSQAGIRGLDTSSDVKRIMLTNRLGIISVFFTFPYVIGFLIFGYYSIAAFSVGLIVIYSCIPLFSKYGHFNSAKVALYMTVLVHQFVVASVFGREAGIHLLYIALVLLPIVMYDYKRDVYWVIFYMAVTVAALLLLYYTEFSMFHIDVDPQVILALDIAYKITTMAGVVVILATSLYVAESTEKILDADNLFLQQQLKAIFDNSQDALMLVDIEEKKIVKLNKRSTEMFGMTERELLGSSGVGLHKNAPTDQEISQIRMDLASSGNHLSEVLYRTRDGEEFWGSLAIRLIHLNGKRYQMVRISDITVQHSIQQKLKSSLQEKEILLAEIHHRVKNNLAVISGLLGLQATYTEDEHAKKLFAESRNRIHSMALIHDKLYRHESFARIDFHAYISDLVEHIRKSYNATATDISFDVTCKEIFLDIKNAVPCGLILNELISNACKHAFRDREKGEIRIVCTKMGEKFTMMVSDNGIGYDMATALERADSLGLTLINALAEQVNGEVTTSSKNGTSFYLSFEV